MTNYRTYKFLIKPSKSQKEQIKKTFEYCTYVYNKYILEKESGINKKEPQRKF